MPSGPAALIPIGRKTSNRSSAGKGIVHNLPYIGMFLIVFAAGTACNDESFSGDTERQVVADARPEEPTTVANPEPEPEPAVAEEEETCTKKVAVTLLLDTSQSMVSPEDRMGPVKNAASALTRVLVGHGAVGMVGFGGQRASEILPMVSVTAANVDSVIGAKIRAIEAVDVGGTNITDAFRKAITMFRGGYTKWSRVVVLITDGNQNASSETVEPETLAKTLTEDGARIITVGIGLSKWQKGWLKTLASRPADALEAETAADLTNHYKSITEKIDCE